MVVESYQRVMVVFVGRATGFWAGLEEWWEKGVKGEAIPTRPAYFYDPLFQNCEAPYQNANLHRKSWEIVEFRCHVHVHRGCRLLTRTREVELLDEGMSSSATTHDAEIYAVAVWTHSRFLSDS